MAMTSIPTLLLVAPLILIQSSEAKVRERAEGELEKSMKKMLPFCLPCYRVSAYSVV